ncbi:DUF4974 domain-containing protein [Echinicola soli]|uniref:DUF4974 domain-containing protein n=1 Tax=Echinicola soli TaxID=2591634 RepID=A0A514CIW3_9BACT|nr:FecR domain-containing protein [Echinicola soli]QDH79759.1 DUF4974 domain-containing protein [Echinicola soli]
MVDRKQFNDLLKRYLKGETGKDENKAVDQWFKKSFEGKSIGEHQDLTALGKEILTQISVKLNKTKTGQRKIVNLYTCHWWKTAAAIFLLLVGGYWIIAGRYQNAGLLTKSTGNGEQLHLKLPDGSTVMLNVASSIQYPEKFGKDRREVSVTGEAFFKVVADPGRPFHVNTENLVTEVLGTQFNVHAYPSEQSQVDVFEGKVKVYSRANSSQKELLKVNQAASFNDQGKLHKHPANLKMAAAWRERMNYMDNTSLDELGKLIERWYGHKVTFIPHSLGDCTLSGKLKMGELELLLNQIKFIKEIDWEISGNNTIVFKGQQCN